MTTTHLKKDDGTIYIYTEALAKRKDMTPYEVEAPKPVHALPPDMLTENYLHSLKGLPGKKVMAQIAADRFGEFVDPMTPKVKLVELLLQFQEEHAQEA